MTNDPRDEIKREYTNRAIRAERIMRALETLARDSSITSEDGKDALEAICGNRKDEIADVISNWVFDVASAKIIQKLAFLVLAHVKETLKSLEEKEVFAGEIYTQDKED